MSNGLGGAFQTSRQIFDNPIWQDVIKFRLFFFIVGNAVFSDSGVRVGNITLQRGQFLRSYRNLSADLEYLDSRSIKRYSISVIMKKVHQLVEENRLEIEETELGTLFTVVNYAVYQGFDHYKNTTKNSERTEREQNENGTETEQEQNENNNKNVKKDKNDKKVLKDIEQDELARQFETLWKMYPNKKGKAKSFLSFKSAIKKGTEYQSIENGLKAYVDYCNATDWYKPAHGQTWFNGARWEDDHAIELKRDVQGGTNYEAPKTNHPDGFDW